MIDDIVSLLGKLRPNGIKPEAYESVVQLIIEMVKLKVTEDETDLQVPGRQVDSINGTLAPAAYIAGNSSGVSTERSFQETVFPSGERPDQATD